MAKGDMASGGASSGVNSGSQTKSNFNKFMPNMGGAHYGGGGANQGTMSGIMSNMVSRPQMQPATQNQYQQNNPYMGSAPGGISQGGGMMPQMGQQDQGMMHDHVMPMMSQQGAQIANPYMPMQQDPQQMQMLMSLMQQLQQPQQIPQMQPQMGGRSFGFGNNFNPYGPQ